MNIFKRELRAGLKPFVFWMIGMFVLVFVGIVKYEGLNTGGASMSDMVTSFPRIVQAVMGIVGVDINTLGGYTAILNYYVLICAVIYAVHLGAGAVVRESVDKTYEFIFTKPASRSRVLAVKLAASWVYLLLFCVFTAVFSVMAVGLLKTYEDITATILLFALSVFLVGSLFIALSAFMAAMAKRPDKGALYGSLAFLYAFILGVICNMLENPGILRLISPFTYFIPADLIAGRFDPVYTVIALLLAAAFLFGAFLRFKKKDLS
ncbi:ABC-2 type transport system permease protein [Sporobacter termitidis DSM 10068]|uniref:ABC-2 type transport system permease protein n=1 Tax=Sporobacter termitidis DSM 10068 TaxID=1123282 RepID=A0A1M5WW42_9FIRM|nr:ABC transporter permease subunit [Sporobacter termitidis]SHH91846.1 ABC-2 type transport system permease protein [Sporobacter termitidis DSM 10068]